MTEQVAMTRVEAKATWVAEMFRPAKKRLSIVPLQQERKGIE
jgi:hypothetical protein